MDERQIWVGAVTADGAPPSPSAWGRQLSADAAAAIYGAARQAAPALQTLVAGDVVRVVGGSAEDLARVVGDPGLRRGFTSGPDGIAGHAKLKPVRGGAAASLGLSVASFALGCWWEQQVSTQLRAIEASLDRIEAGARRHRDAALSVALDELRIVRALPLGSLVGPTPAAIVDAQQVMYDRLGWLVDHLDGRARAQRDSAHAVPLAAHLRLLEDPEVTSSLRQYTAATLVDVEWRRLQALDASAHHGTALSAAIADVMADRRDAVRAVSRVIGGILGTPLRADRVGWAEHALPGGHGGRLGARRAAIVDGREALREEERLLLGLQRVIPDRQQQLGPFAVTLRAGADAALEGWVEQGTGVLGGV